MERVVRIIEGKVFVNPYGDWDDVDKGVYVDDDNIENLIYDYRGRRIKITIEEVDEAE